MHKIAKLFGTDGIRGTPGTYPLTDEMLVRIARATAQSILPKKQGPKRPKIAIGKDTRLSGEQIEKSLANTIKDEGVDVVLVGTITTPGLSFLTKTIKASAGIMISASHNKATDNGLKFFDAQGNKFSNHKEQKIEDLIFIKSSHPTPWGLSPSEASGTVPMGHLPKGRIYSIKNAQAKYSQFLISTTPSLDLKGIKIALDCAWGAASPFAKKIFTSLGAKVTSIHDKPSGHNINEGGALNPRLLKELVLKTKADIGIAVDGDGDRGILVDEKGQIVDGDCILAVFARYLQKENRLLKNTVVGTVMSNYGLKVALDEIGVKMITANVGDKYVLESLLENDLILGGEQSGHIIFLNHHPSPDGLLTALQLLKVMHKTKSSLSQLCRCMTKFPQILINVKVKEKRPFAEIPFIEERLKQFNAQLKDQGRILLRYSGTESLARVMVEGRDHDVIKNIANSLADHIRQEIGVE
ncbi:MAG: phosphoglucosamine mutase [Candidatus Omnitrophota bacterium]